MEIAYYIYNLEEDRLTLEEGDFWDALKAKSQSNPLFFYDTYEFHRYHGKNAEKLFGLSVITGEKRLGFCVLGQRGQELRLGYSAPFGEVYLVGEDKSRGYHAMAMGLKAMATETNLMLRLTFPPDIYSGATLLKLGIFSGEGFQVDLLHVNNYFDLKQISSMESFAASRSHSYRKNLKRGFDSGLTFRCGENKEDLALAYQVIRQNREEKNYPLAMSWEQIQDIAALPMPAGTVDSFLVLHQEIPVAGAIVFYPSAEVGQVIYWGNLADYGSQRPMEFLSYHMVGHYCARGLSYLDIGPSTVDHSVSYGMLSFKTNIGCKTGIKPVMLYSGASRS